MKALRITLRVVGVLLILLVLGIGVFLATFDANRFKPRIEAAALAATGRTLTIGGDLALKISLIPTLVANDVTFANIAGGSRPAMATLERLEVQVALLPLLSRRVEVSRLVLVRPDILLERLADGRANWDIAPAAAPAAPDTASRPASRQEPPAADAGAPAIAIAAIRIEDGRIAFADATTKASATYDIKRLDAALPADGPTTLSAETTINGTAVTLRAETGPLARLLAPAPDTPFPFSATVEAAGAQVGAEGSILWPQAMAGWKVALAATVPDLAALTPLAQGFTLPPVRDLALKVDARDSGGPVPTFSALTLTAGAADLGAFAPGLRLEKLEVAAPAIDQPVRLSLAAAMNGAPVTLSGTLGAPAALLPGGAAQPLPVDLAWQAADAKGTVKGTIADARAITGVDLALAATVPELAALGKLAGAQLPALRDIAAQAQLAGRGAAFAQGAQLRALKVTLPQGDLAGDVTLAMGARPAVQAKLASQRLDADALMAALAAPADGAPAAAPPPPPRPAPAGGTLIPDTPLPFEALTLADADADLTLAALTLAGQAWKDVHLVATLKNGRLAVSPLTLTGPGGRAEITASADARQAAPPVALSARMPALALAPLLEALGQGRTINGTAQVDLDLRGAGRTPHAIAASAAGHFGFALAGGDIDNRLIDLLAGDILRAVGASFNREGRSNIRCVALRFEATGGVAEARALLADTSLATLDGGGAVNLGRETLALRVRPTLKVGPVRIAAPVLVSGPWLRPTVGLDPSAAGQAVGQVLGGIAAGRNPLQALRGAGEPTAADDCPRQLAIARGGAAGPAPPAAEAPPAAAPAAPATPQRPTLPANPRDLLRGLIR